MVSFIDDHREAYGVVLREPQDKADLQGAADRPVDLLCACRPACRPRQATGSCSQRRRVDNRDPARVRGELLRLQCAEGVAATGPGGHRDHAMHGGAADAPIGLGGGCCVAGVCAPRSPTRPLPALSTASTVSSRLPAERPVGQRLRLRGDVVGLRLCGVRHRCVSPGASSADGPHAVLMQASFFMLWSRPCTSAVLSKVAAGASLGSWFAILTLRYTERLVGAGIEPSVGSVATLTTPPWRRRSTACSRRRRSIGAGRGVPTRAVEYATLEWVDWYNHRRLLAPIGNVPPPSRSALSYSRRRPSPGRLTQDKQPPKNTERFTWGDRVVSGAAVPAVSVQLSPYAPLSWSGRSERQRRRHSGRRRRRQPSAKRPGQGQEAL